MIATNRHSSENQFRLLVQIVQERGQAAKVYVDTQLAANHVSHPRELSFNEMRNVIGVVLDMPRTDGQQAATAASPEPEAGVYETPDQRWFRVYLGQQSGKMLVKEIHAEHDLMGDMDVSYEYLGMATKHLPGNARRMSVEEVGSLGIATNHCMVCGRRLDDPESIDRGIGPVCASNY